MTHQQKLKGIYAITDTQLAHPNKLIDQVQQALDGGISLLQYRDKHLSDEQRLHEAEILLKLCENYHVPLIINDDVRLAVRSGAHGVHLGKDDGDYAQARMILGEQAIIGITCYNDFSKALEAQASGADYVAFGRFFHSSIKPQAMSADIERLIEAKQRLLIPTVAIGGITPENAAPLVQAGADMLAVIHSIFGQPDIHAATVKYIPLFPHAE